MRDGKSVPMLWARRHRRPVRVQTAKMPSGTEIVVRFLGVLLAGAMPFPRIAPFGLVFLAMERRGGLTALLSWLTVTLGYLLLTGDEALRYIAACTVYEAALLLAASKDDADRTFCGSVAVTALLLCDTAAMIWTGIGVRTVAVAAADGILTAVGIAVFDRCRRMMDGRSFFAGTLTDAEKASLCAVGGVVLWSLQTLPIPFPFSIANAVGLGLVGTVAVCGGALYGVAAGLAVGLILGLHGELLTFLAVFGCIGFCGGTVRRYGKWGTATAMTVSGIVLCLYAMVSGSEAVRFYEIPFGALLTAVLPSRAAAAVKRCTEFSFGEERERLWLRSRLRDKLETAADSFAHLAESFAGISDEQSRMEMTDIGVLFDTAAERVCKRCGRRTFCWEQNARATYRVMARMLEVLERKGMLEREDTGGNFAERCLRSDAFIKEVNRLFEIYKINRVWKSKLCENRELVGQQFCGVAETLRRIAEEVSAVCVSNSVAEEEITHRLQSRGFAVDAVRVIQAEHGSGFVQMLLPQCLDAEECKTACSVLKGVLGIGFLPARDVRRTNGGIRMQFYEVPHFCIGAGCASDGKREENGDSYALHRLQGGKFLATLSDGMGCGQRAKKESDTIVTLLEDFMDAGFDKRVAVKLINSAMVMKSADEAFATVDMCMIDLNSGEAEFVKNGAAPTYIKRGSRVETVRSASLPVGVLSQVEVETFARRLEVGDTVVMVSDGMELKQSGGGWIRHTLQSVDPQMPPQELADRLTEQAVALKGGSADDDMTVLVLRLL